MNASDNRFYRAAADRAAIDAVLAEAIYAELVADYTAAAVLDLWQHRHIGASDLADMRAVLATVAANAIDKVLARRVREAARTGPWPDCQPTTDDLERAREAVEAFPSYAFNRQHTEVLVKEVAIALREERERCARPRGETARTGRGGP